jgi:hypothetical protein
MTFQADEVRELNVAYEIPMAVALVDTRKDQGIEIRRISYSKKWYSELEMAIAEGLDYVTETGQSWAGPIEHAKFEVHVREFERYLADRCIVETKEPKADHERGKTYFDWHIKNRLIHRAVGPDGWKEKDGVLTWDFTNYRPEEGIGVGYTLTILPKTPESVPSFVKSVLGDKPSKEDLNALREIYLAWWGISPKSESVRRFVSNQRWYVSKDGMTADKLTAEQKAVIAALERCSTANNGK